MRRLCRRDGRRSPRAGLVTRPPGGSGTPSGRHYDRPAGSLLDWDWPKRLTAAEASSQEARTWS
jgi:hypothetical protein